MKNYKELLNHINTLIFDFDGVVSQNICAIAPDGELIRTSNIKDGYALQLAKKLGYNIAVISGGKSEAPIKRLERLGITDVFIKIKNKEQKFDEYCKEKQISPEQVIYMGDDLPDYKVLKKVAIPTCPEDAVEEIKEISFYISHKKGGEGCVRDIIEQVLKCQGKWVSEKTYEAM